MSPPISRTIEQAQERTLRIQDQFPTFQGKDKRSLKADLSALIGLDVPAMVDDIQVVRRMLMKVKGYFLTADGCSKCGMDFDGQQERHWAWCLIGDINEVLWRN